MVTKPMSKGDVSINGQLTDNQPGVATAGSAVCQPPLIDDSLIADDDGGLPLISAVYSLAANGNQQNGEESSSSGMSLTSKAGSPQIINIRKAVTVSPNSSVKDGNEPSGNSVNLKVSSGISLAAFQNTSSPPSKSVGSNSLQSTFIKTPSETTISEGTVTSESPKRKASLDASDARAGTQFSVTTAASDLQPSGVSQLVKLVDSVPKQPPQSIPLLTASTAVNSQPPSLVPITSLTSNNPVKQITHVPRQIAMKQPGTTTSIVLNLKPGEPLPKAINLLGPDGKSVVFLSLSDGGKPLPSQFVQTGGKILIPISSSVGSSLASKQIAFVNKVANVSSGQVPIAPHPGRTTVLSPTAISSPVRLSVSDSLTSQRPLVASNVVGAAGPSLSRGVPNAAEASQLPVTVAGSSNVASSTMGGRDGLSSNSAAFSTNTTSPETKPTTSTADKQEGLSPQEARIQRLKELIKTQEDAVNKLREKRRLEIERIREQSFNSKPDEDNDSKPERPPLTEQKRSSSPFAVPLPPKKRIKEQDASFKTKVPKTTDSSVLHGEGAFIPNGDDKSFVQLVGLENVVNNIT